MSQDLVDFVRRHRPAEKEALEFIATRQAQNNRLFFALNALGRDRNVERIGKSHGCLNDIRRVRLVIERGYE